MTYLQLYRDQIANQKADTAETIRHNLENERLARQSNVRDWWNQVEHTFFINPAKGFSDFGNGVYGITGGMGL